MLEQHASFLKSDSCEEIEEQKKKLNKLRKWEY
jgi:hypothetical protein